MNNNYIHNLWERIISNLVSKPIEIQTILLNSKEGIWFSANSIYGDVIITKAQKNKPSSKIKYPRKISEYEFIKLYPYYCKWKTKDVKREYIRNLSKNTSYIFALINYFEKGKKTIRIE